MPRTTTSARRYAEAAFDLASTDDSFDRWAKDLDLLAETLGRDDVAKILDNPAIPRPDRAATVDRLLGDTVSRQSQRLAQVLVERSRATLLPSIASAFHELLDRRRGIVRAVVTTAAPLSDGEAEAVRRRVAAMAGAEVQIDTQVDESLIGGLTVQLGDRLLDASVRGRLERLRHQLITGARSR